MQIFIKQPKKCTLPKFQSIVRDVCLCFVFVAVFAFVLFCIFFIVSCPMLPCTSEFTIRLRQILGAPRECSENYPKVRTLFVPSFIQVQTKTNAQTRTEGQTAAQCGSPQFFSLFSSHSLSVRRKRTPTRDLS